MFSENTNVSPRNGKALQEASQTVTDSHPVQQPPASPHPPHPGPLSGGVASTPVSINSLKALAHVFSVLILAPECLFLQQ